MISIYIIKAYFTHSKAANSYLLRPSAEIHRHARGDHGKKRAYSSVSNEILVI